jgi:hypothetical protein
MPTILRLFALTAAVALGAVADPAVAKPKRPHLHGCSSAQIQSPAAGACIRQMERDVANGRAYWHALYCEVGGMMCCQTDGSRTFACKPVASAGMPRPDWGVHTPVGPSRVVDPGPRGRPQRPPEGAPPTGPASRPPIVRPPVGTPPTGPMSRPPPPRPVIR